MGTHVMGLGRKVLVVGGAGYIGGPVVDVLQRGGHQVAVYDALWYEPLYQKELELTVADVRHTAALDPWLKWADAVVWLAAVVGDKACQVDPTATLDINVGAVQHLASVFHGLIVYVSTCSVYGAQDGLLDEDAPTQPLSLYAESKLRAEQALAGSQALIFRLGTVYGFGDHYSRPRFDLLVNRLSARAACALPLQVFGGQQHRPFINVWDVARGIAIGLTSGKTGLYNLVADNLSIDNVAEVVRATYGATIERQEGVHQDLRNYLASGEKADRELGFRPVHALEMEIAVMARQVELGRIRDIDDPRYHNAEWLGGHKELLAWTS